MQESSLLRREAAVILRQHADKPHKQARPRPDCDLRLCRTRGGTAEMHRAVEHLMGVIAPAHIWGSLLLCAGLLIGVWLGKRRAPGGSQTPESRLALRVLERLLEWTAGFASEVSEYRSVVDRLTSRFNCVGEESAGDDNPARQRAATLGLLEQVVAANENVQQRLAAAEDKLQHQATEIASYVSEARTDALTGLPNRRAFDEELRRRFAEWRRHGSPLSLLLVDIDHFKALNDCHGHLAGDAALRDVAQSLHDTMRQSDLVTRFGGEEFAIVLPNSDIGEARQAAERARHAVEQRVFRHETSHLRMTVSCGAAQAAINDDATSLIGRADAALYAAKGGGRNAAYWHDGAGCLPVNLAIPTNPEAAAAPAQRSPGRDLSNDFGRLCGDLRRRLKEFVAQDSTAP